ncbi:nucleotidyltransferase family protein [Candidatus Chloroploca sp. Khr17]|uniref:nucleotidyltransferase domain-containing protein n=1 Tax=Candidatus Chloroploca sp. Khr17 TaxID=2496869 RepID=UPI0013ED5A7F|nr:nucleotidyltransferase family protein [Candidatus Chloroploca sp. Khr17]
MQRSLNPGLTWPAWLVPQEDDRHVVASLESLTPEDWSALLAAATRHNLVGMLAWRLKQPSLIGCVPERVQAQLSQIQRTAAVRGLVHQAELHRVLRALGAVGVQPVVYKGALVAHTLYPEPGCRPMGDIDLWIADDEVPRAWQAMEGLGYQQRSKSRRPLALQRERDGEIQFYSDAPGHGLIELHWGVFAGEWLRWASSVDRAGVRERIEPIDLLGHPVYRLAHEDALIQLAVHAAINHQLSGNALRSLLDVALLAQQRLDWATVAQRVQAWGLATAVSLVFALVAEIYRVPAILSGLALLPLPVHRYKLVTHFIDAQRIIEGYDLSASPRRLLYQLTLIDRPGDTFRLLHGALWPEVSWIHRRYGSSDLRTRLQHTLGVLQGKV